MADDIRLLFKAAGDTDDAKKAFKSLKESVDSDLNAIKNAAGTQLASVGSSLASLAAPATIAVGAITGIAVAVVGAGASLFNFTKDAAEYSSAIFDAKIRTGLTAEAITTLGFAAKISGSDLEVVSRTVSKFNVTVGEAEQGNKRAIDTLKKYGITSHDTTEAFSQAITTIGQMTAADQKAVAARELFKDKTGEMLPIVDQLDGNFKKYIETAKKLGVTLTEEDLRAADEFGDTLDLLGEQAKIAGVKFASQLMPMCTDAMKAISAALADNQGIAQQWGRELANTITGTARIMEYADGVFRSTLVQLGVSLAANETAWQNWSNNAQYWIQRAATAVVTSGISEALRGAEKVGEANRTLAGMGGAFKPPPSLVIPKAGGGGKGGGGAKAPKDNAAARDLEADIRDQKRLLDEAEKQYKTTIANLLEAFDLFGDKASTELGLHEAVQKFTDTSAVYLAEYRRFETQKDQLSGDTDAKRRLREQAAEDRNKKFGDARLEGEKKVDDKIADADLDLAEARAKIEEDLNTKIEAARKDLADREIAYQVEWYKEQIALAGNNIAERNQLISDGMANARVLLEAEYQRELELNKEAADKEKLDIEEKFKGQADLNQRLEDLENLHRQKDELSYKEYQEKLKQIREEINPDDQMVEVKGLDTVAGTIGFGIQNYLKNVVLAEDANKKLKFSFQQTFNTIADIGLQAFGQLAQGFGQMVANWVLYGNQGGNGIRKMFAQVLAGVAQMATTYAVMCLAAAALATTVWGAAILGGTPAQFLQAAALFGAVAVTAAVAGRVIAGNSFAQTASTPAGSSASSGTGQGQTHGNSVFSSQTDETIDQSRNAPGGAGISGRLRSEITLKIVSTKDHIVTVVKENVSRNGQLRTVIQDAAAS